MRHRELRAEDPNGLRSNGEIDYQIVKEKLLERARFAENFDELKQVVYEIIELLP